MAKKSLINKANRLKARAARSIAMGKKPEKPTRIYNRCRLCGRIHAYMRAFDMCRICFRELADKGLIPGIKKASW